MTNKFNSLKDKERSFSKDRDETDKWIVSGLIITIIVCTIIYITTAILSMSM